MEKINQKNKINGKYHNKIVKELINQNQSSYKRENKILEINNKEEKNNRKDCLFTKSEYNDIKNAPNFKSLNKLSDKISNEIFENGINFDDKNLKGNHSEEENKINIKKEIRIGENNLLNNNLNLDLTFSTNKDKICEDKKIINENEILNKEINLPFNLQIDKDLIDKIEYAIDEKGNPFSIKNNNEEKEKNKIKKPIAFIIKQKGKNNNLLIDIKGKSIPKLEDGYYNYKNDNIRILIKDFDVQYPELRIYGTSKKELIFDENKEDKKIQGVISESKNKKFILNKNILNIKADSPIIIKKEILNNKINYFKKLNERKIIEDQKTFRNEVFYRKIKPKRLNSDNISFNNNKYNNRNSETIIRTNNILNKSSSRFYTNRNNISNFRIEPNYNKISFDQSDLLKNKDENKSVFNEISNIPFTQEINNISHTISRINLYKHRKLIKRGGSFGGNYNRIFNLKSLLSKNNTIKKKEDFLNSKEDKNTN